ncbi:MAG: hypothetical protein P4L33_08810 [Capsulimonadaceae bacterium]|nr:hypothetical protein [Capsulimonadaceae bacterium]
MIQRIITGVAALGAALAVAGCGGGDAGGVRTAPTVTGYYAGAYVKTTGASAGSMAYMTVQTNGSVEFDKRLTATTLDTYTGTLAGNTLSVTDSANDTIVGTVSTSGSYWTLNYVEGDGSRGTFSFGLIHGLDAVSNPVAVSPNLLTGTYVLGGTSGTAELTMGEAPDESVTGNLTPTGGSAIWFSAIEDASGNLFAVYNNGTSYENVVGAFKSATPPFTNSLSEIPSGKTLALDITAVTPVITATPANKRR